MKKNYIKIILDLAMAITFVLLMNPRVLNGLPFHEIAGLAIGVAILTHIGLNFKWVINTTKKIFDNKLPKKTRFSYVLNLLLLVSMSSIIVTGILISRVVFPNLSMGENHGFRGLHNLSANLTLALVGLHIGVHWQWIMSICKKLFKTKDGKMRKGILTSTVFILLLVAGGLQWYSSTASNGSSFNKKITEQNQRFQGPPNGEFREKRGGGSALLVILQYFLIFTVIIIPTYYIEKRLLRRRT
jgi:hypothetical protein